MIFADRSEAGRRLATALAVYGREHPVVLALPRGGVPVAAEVARTLNAPMDLLIVRKLGLPGQAELAMGAVVDGATPTTVRNEEVIALAAISEAEFAACRDRELAEIRRRRERYLGGRSRADLGGRTVIVVDDGIATGATMRAALRSLRRHHPKKVVLAVPVATLGILEALRDEVDDIVGLEAHGDLGAIGYYYRNFDQVSDEQVIATLEAIKPKT